MTPKFFCALESASRDWLKQRAEVQLILIQFIESLILAQDERWRRA